MSYGQQNSELTVFLIALAVILIIVLVIAVVMIVRRNQRGLTLKNSTFGNNIEGDRVVPTDHSQADYSSSAGVVSDSTAKPADAPAHRHTGNSNADAGSAHHTNASGSSSDFGGGTHHGH
jgi:predicted lipid-binding transport protein (Tim44 family)